MGGSCPKCPFNSSCGGDKRQCSAVMTGHGVQVSNLRFETRATFRDLSSQKLSELNGEAKREQGASHLMAESSGGQHADVKDFDRWLNNLPNDIAAKRKPGGTRATDVAPEDRGEAPEDREKHGFFGRRVQKALNRVVKKDNLQRTYAVDRLDEILEKPKRSPPA